MLLCYSMTCVVTSPFLIKSLLASLQGKANKLLQINRQKMPLHKQVVLPLHSPEWLSDTQPPPLPHLIQVG